MAHLGALQGLVRGRLHHTNGHTRTPGLLTHGSIRHARIVLAGVSSKTAMVSQQRADAMIQPTYKADDRFFTERGQRDLIQAMELDTITPDLPALLLEMGIRYDPDKLAAQLSSKWPQV
eukprot:GHRR01030993.1.p2 GENE.GHRR01030993.1~~GHRR01030993.1.p2  ORF type:complete len:119 (+),score=41.86 GHRR01030993.1:305-661(+)